MYVPHAVAAVLEQKERHWLSNNQLLKYQALLLEQDDATLKTISAHNPAMLRLWEPDVNGHGQSCTGIWGALGLLLVALHTLSMPCATSLEKNLEQPRIPRGSLPSTEDYKDLQSKAKL